MENKWVLKSSAVKSNARFRLFCFPYSGGSASYYSEWNKFFGDEIEIMPIQYPGHESRSEEPLISDVKELAEAALEGIVPYTDDIDFGFFGHSLGSLVAYETAVLFYEYELKPPNMVILSSAGTNFDRVQPPVHTLDGEELKRTIIAFGGVASEDILYSEGFDNFYAPLLKNDFSAAENYKIDEDSFVMAPFHILYGEDDKFVTRKDVEKWSEHTEGKCTYYSFSGDHFYLNNKLKTVCEKVKGIIEKSV